MNLKRSVVGDDVMLSVKGFKQTSWGRCEHRMELRGSMKRKRKRKRVGLLLLPGGAVQHHSDS